jgi:hypothetical protein
MKKPLPGSAAGTEPLPGSAAGTEPLPGSLPKKLCSCIKKVRKTVRLPTRKAKEQRAIAICVKSVLWSRGKTLKRFRCKKPMLEVQEMKK